MNIDNSFKPNKISRYTFNPLPNPISSAYISYVSTLNNPSEPIKVSILLSDAPENEHIITRYKYGYTKETRGYWSSQHSGIM